MLEPPRSHVYVFFGFQDSLLQVSRCFSEIVYKNASVEAHPLDWASIGGFAGA
jgi:hypothetical protein